MGVASHRRTLAWPSRSNPRLIDCRCASGVTMIANPSRRCARSRESWSSSRPSGIVRHRPLRQTGGSRELPKTAGGSGHSSLRTTGAFIGFAGMQVPAETHPCAARAVPSDQGSMKRTTNTCRPTKRTVDSGWPLRDLHSMRRHWLPLPLNVERQHDIHRTARRQTPCR